MDYTAGDIITLNTPDGPAEIEVVGSDGDNVTLSMNGRSQTFRRAIIDHEVQRANTPQPRTSVRQPRSEPAPGRATAPRGAVRDAAPQDRRAPDQPPRPSEADLAGMAGSQPPQGTQSPPRQPVEPGRMPRGPVADPSVAVEHAAGRHTPAAEAQIMRPRTAPGAIRPPAPGQPSTPSPGAAPQSVDTSPAMPPVYEPHVTGRNKRGRPNEMGYRVAMPPETSAPAPEAEAAPQMSRGERRQQARTGRLGPAEQAPAEPAAPSTQAPAEPADASKAAPVVANAVQSQSGPASEVLATGAESLGAVRPDGAAKTEPQQQRESRQIELTYLESWKKNAMPGIVEGLVGRGMFDEAERVMAFGERAEFQSGVKRYAAAAMAAARGDMDTFADQMTVIFDDEYYNPDGFTVDRAASRWIKNDAGQIAGAELTFIDEDGEKIVQRWDNWTSMVEEMLTAMSPERALQRHLDSEDAARSARADYAKSEADFADFVRREVVKAGLSGDGSAQEDVDGALDTLSKDPAFGAMTEEQKLEAVLKILRTRDSAVAVRKRGGLGAVRPVIPEPMRH